ncbi:Gamma-glutamyl hydrolase 2 [Cymbomonas tetramitiformis]|uniref:Gamma-glutamyl hydrolase 2 n=1 Tax=Cymbomonas tetramitiformis TaxID=36881 RepID=A0AAE0FLE5_9CHLO|nr:Gamma-glutamyl hydrolase 2 [Cymbomonas tetramitiformis]
MSSELQSFFQATSVSEDKNKVPYISTVEAKQYPIIGTQWHPEKNLFEWTSTEAIPHGADAAKLAQRVANLLVDRARRSCHKPSPAEVEDLLIYNYSPVYPAKGSSKLSAEERLNKQLREMALSEANSRDRLKAARKEKEKLAQT